MVSPLQALKHAIVASRGERDFRKDKADGVRRKEVEVGDEWDDDDDVGEVERVLGVADVSSTEASDSELTSDWGSVRPRVDRCSWACCWSRTDKLATPNTSSFLAWLESLSSAGQVIQTGRVSQHRWTITCWTLSRRPSCCSKESTLQTKQKMEKLGKPFKVYYLNFSYIYAFTLKWIEDLISIAWHARYVFWFQSFIAHCKTSSILTHTSATGW